MWDSPQAITHPISKSYRSVHDTWAYPAIPQTHWEVVVFHDPPVDGFSWVTMAVGWLWIPPWRLSPESEVFSDRQRSSFSKAPSGQRSASVRRPFGVGGGSFFGVEQSKTSGRVEQAGEFGNRERRHEESSDGRKQRYPMQKT